MLILPDYGKPYIIDNLNSPLAARYYWAFSATLLDYKLCPISYIEETIGTVITIEINGVEFDIPYNWNIIVSDNETLKLDCMPLEDCKKAVSYALIMTPADGKFRTAKIIFKGIKENTSLCHPLIQRNTAMCHPVTEIKLDNGDITIGCIVIGPFDFYKLIENKLYGDLI